MPMTSLAQDLASANLAGGADLVDQAGARRVAFGSWTDAVRRSVLSFRFDCDRPGAFSGVISNRTVAGINFVNMACGRHRAHRDRATISPEDAGYYVLTLQLSGRLRLSQHGRTADVEPGHYAVYDASEPASVTASDDYRSTCIRFPKRYLGGHQDNPLEHITATPFEVTAGLPAAVWGALISLNRNLGALGPNGSAAVHDVMNMVSTLLLHELGQRPEPAPGNELLLEQVRDYVDAHLADPDLTPARIAAAHYISPRHLHGLFEGTGTTVARWIRQRRVEEGRRDLADPSQARVPIAAIAARRGFRGPTRFTEAFKQNYGITPAEFRREIL
jgi:AraC-like DNA-binding protein